MTQETIRDRIRGEIGHWLRRDWTFAAVGAHWDAVEDYDSINKDLLLFSALRGRSAPK